MIMFAFAEEELAATELDFDVAFGVATGDMLASLLEEFGIDVFDQPERTIWWSISEPAETAIGTGELVQAPSGAGGLALTGTLQRNRV